MTAALQIGFTVAVAMLAGCAAEAPALEVSPGEVDEAGGGKADGDEAKAELKVTIDAGHIRRARSRLSLLNADSQTRRIWFYDTPWLELFEAGVILRAREIDDDEDADDATIKLRPFTLGQLDSEFRGLDDLKCELDRDSDSETSSCSLKADQDEGEIADVGAGDRAIDQLFSSEQEDMLAAHGPGIAWSELTALGPIDARVWTIKTDALPKKLTAELWYMPDGGQVLELSMKVDASDADDGMDALLDFVDGRDLDLADEQESKTRRALDSLTGAAVQQSL